ncbi:MarR family winged helix-turn-helix transcriptional regulator [Streptococcus sp. zg-JUN1979]|uniref:MarR family winged helix-turn-helix transcriptional regulator n=1 Tax=Streptococcus sp. zg-JUN1979 TaxID=3391450 RepID=UPI0039A68C98
MKDPFSEFRSLITQVENQVKYLFKQHNVEHLAGPQGFVVSYLYHYQSKEIYIKDIESRLHISKSVASNLIRRMEKNGFITVVHSQKDKRYKRLVLTELGVQKAKELTHVHTVIHSQILQGISLDDLKVTKKVIRKIQENTKKEE